MNQVRNCFLFFYRPIILVKVHFWTWNFSKKCSLILKILVKTPISRCDLKKFWNFFFKKNTFLWNARKWGFWDKKFLNFFRKFPEIFPNFLIFFIFFRIPKHIPPSTRKLKWQSRALASNFLCQKGENARGTRGFRAGHGETPSGSGRRQRRKRPSKGCGFGLASGKRVVGSTTID